jgi:hypothetical protein
VLLLMLGAVHAVPLLPPLLLPVLLQVISFRRSSACCRLLLSVG